jgi:hypothetical protein
LESMPVQQQQPPPPKKKEPRVSQRVPIGSYRERRKIS